MTVVTINAIPSNDSTSASTSVKDKFLITNYDTGHHIEREISRISPSSLEEFRWYLEDYAERDPFDSERALKACSALTAYGEDLISSLELTAVIPTSKLNESLVIQINEHDPAAGVSHIFWELLERPELWRPSHRPGSVTVLRTIDSKEHSSRASAPKDFSADELRVLVVTARSGDDGDVAPRLVSRLLVEATQRYENPVEVEIVRPGTFEAMKTHLESRDAGYFDVVHFDMHGIEDMATGTVLLKFVKHEEGSQSLKLRSDYRMAAEIGALLQERRVGRAVLNACRSAYGSSPDTNIASAFVHAGVPVVLAMSYTIADRSVEIFTEMLYQGMVEHRLPLEAAASLARRAMLYNPGRTTRFGSEVKVGDSIVPVVYMDAAVERLLPEKLPELKGLEETQDLRRLFPYGRELDIMHLESALLIENKPVLLTGQAGIGKTTLLNHLRGWWRTTGLVKDAIHVQLPSDPFDADALYGSLQGYFTGIKSPLSRDRLLAHLAQHRCLIILDRLEAVNMARKYSAFLKLVRWLSKTKALVIIASRRPEKWLGSATISHRLSGLRTIPGTQVVHGILTGARELMNFGDYRSDEDSHYLEQIVSLASGNPLAIRLLAQDGLCVLKSPKEYYFGMLTGAPVMLNRWEAKRSERLRSVVQCEEIIDKLMPERLGDGFTPTVYACFQQVLPTADLTKFAQLWSLATQNQMGNTPQQKAKAALEMFENLGVDLEGVDDNMKVMIKLMRVVAETSEEVPKNKTSLASIIVGYEEIDFPEVPMIGEIWNAPCTKFVSMMKEGGFLEEFPFETSPLEGSQDRKERGLMALHPLVSIVLRAQPGYDKNVFNIVSSSKQGFVNYYCYRTKGWPWRKIYDDPAWTRPRQELHKEFVNFATSALIGLENKNDDPLQLMCLLRLVLVLQRGALKEPGRLRVVAILWERALTRVLVEINAIEVDLQKKPASVLSALDSVVRSGTQPAPEPQSEDEETAETALFSLQGMGIAFATQLALHLRRLHSPRYAEFISIAKSLINDSRTHLPRSFPDEIKERMQRTDAFYESNIDWIVKPPDHGDEFFQERGAYLRFLAHQDGQEYTESPKSWEDIPIEILSLAAQFGHMIPVYNKIRRAIGSNDWKEAERLVDEALVMEINDASNDAMNKAELLEFRSRIAEGQGQWSNALEHMQEAWRLRGGVNDGAPAAEKQTKRAKEVGRLKKRCAEAGEAS